MMGLFEMYLSDDWIWRSTERGSNYDLSFFTDNGLNDYIAQLECNSDIMCVSIANDIVIVILKVPELDGAVIDAYKSRCQNNVLAFNYEGILVWNISEIVGELNFPFSNGFVATSEFVMNNITKDILDCNHEYYVCNTLEGCCFVIDITDKKVVYRKMKK